MILYLLFSFLHLKNEIALLVPESLCKRFKEKMHVNICCKL